MELPPYCQLIQNIPRGKRMCISCRALAGISCYRGTCQHTCQCGIAALAAPVYFPVGNASDFVVVTTCAFRKEGTPQDWKQTEHNLQDLPIDLAALRREYEDLPVLDAEQIQRVQEILEIAAAALSDIIDSSLRELSLDPLSHSAPELGEQGENELDQIRQAVSLIEDGQAAYHYKKGTLVSIVRSLVERNPGLPVTVANLSRAARLTPNHFSMLFKKETGQSFVTYLTEQRIRYACQLLKKRKLNINQVAIKSGFSDTAYFIRRFKQHTGMTPKKWRGHR